MTRGRKPKPTSLKVIAGTYRADRSNEQEPKFDPEIPTPPPFLSDEAKVEWGRVCDALYHAGVLTKTDRAALAAYCQAFGRWQQAEDALAKIAARDQVTHGLVIKTTNGNAVQNPLVGAANKAMADMVRYAAEFGMTPSARSRIRAEGRDGEETEAARYFA